MREKLSLKAIGAATAIVLALATALVLILGQGDGGEQQQQATAAAQAGGSEPRPARPCAADYLVAVARKHDRAEIRRAKRGTFPINDRPVRIEPPVDWNADPQRATSFRGQLHKFKWIDTLLYAYREHGDREAFRHALEVALDWIDQNPRGAPGVSEEAWGNKVTGDRSSYLAYIYRAGRCEGELTANQERKLAASLREHAEVLSDPGYYTKTNHGLFMDQGLTLLSYHLSDMPEARRWGRLGRKRFKRTFLRLIDPHEAFWWEHSSGYQILLTETLQRYLRVPGNEDPKLRRTMLRMRDVAGWLVMPDGELAQLGDSDQKSFPDYVQRRATSNRGLLWLPRSGLAVIKRPDAFLSLAATRFSKEHKHSDELTFDLFDGGHRLVSDTGLYHKDPDRFFDYVSSSQAHSVLTVDGASFPRSANFAYGSGLTGRGWGDGWAAIEGTNPVLRETQGVRHRRLLLYRPGDALLVLDRVRSDSRHTYQRHFQLGPEVDVTRKARSLELHAEGFRGSLTSAGSAGPGRLERVRGQDEPLAGYVSPDFRELVPRWRITYETRGSDVDHVAAFDLDGGAPLEARIEGRLDSAAVVCLREDGEAWSVTVGRDGDRRPVSEGEAC